VNAKDIKKNRMLGTQGEPYIDYCLVMINQIIKKL
jgi:hypothetical protein